MADSAQHVNPAMLANLRRIGGTKLLNEMIRIFLEQVPQKMKTLRSALHNRDADALERAAHSIKSSAGNLGALQLQQIAATMEESAEQDKFDDSRRLWEALQREYRIVADLYKTKLKESS